MKNKFVQALAIITVLLVLCFTLSACDPGSYYFKSEDLADVVNIELINYDNSEQKSFTSWVPDHTYDLKSFDNSKTDSFEKLNDDEKENFIDSLCGYHILYKYFAYDSPKGICIKLNYADGCFIIISSAYVGKFSSDGEVGEFIGAFARSDDYTTLINDYFQTQI